MAEPLTLNLSNSGYHLYGLSHRLGSLQRSLSELETAGLLASTALELEKAGYVHNVGVAPGEDTLALASGTFSQLLAASGTPEVLIVHHAYPDSTSAPSDGQANASCIGRTPYFPALLLQQFELDHLPYMGSFATGCAGVLSLIVTAAGILAYSERNSALCLTADIKPPGATYDKMREKILTSDASSGFIFGREAKGYRVLGLSYYSSFRQTIPVVELVQRSVRMVNELARALGVSSKLDRALFHYPNMFAAAWEMVNHYLKARPEQRVIDDIQGRAHCLSSDSVISLQKRMGSGPGTLHIILNVGSGLHLGVGILEEV